MSIHSTAILAYGIILDEEENRSFLEHPNHDEVSDRFAIYANSYCNDGDVIIGVRVKCADEGECEIIQIKEPNIDALLDILDELEIKREPEWILVSELG